ncbi:MAG: HipA domain-containing protein [Bacteroidales bacterium]|jgi:serine/threonine-protein kinase HipA|nr:HipA domain-containing protein [Bacteroidales bacterium]MDD4385529.1 HipA domain-containing protein [Bacteroidales bacterium]
MNKCLYCYETLNEGEVDFHPTCSRKIFGQPTPPELPYTENELEELGLQVVQSQITITGVQPKLSLHLEKPKDKSQPRRFAIVGLWGGYILKPPTANYPQLPEVEDLTMHLASIAGIMVVPHSLIRMQSGKLAYITKRIDRIKQKKLHMEDMCQLTERLTEDKYHGSYEQIGKAILRYSANPGLDLVNFAEQLLFSFLTGNADMHLKNFSLLHQQGTGPVLSPAYDMVSTVLVNPADDEDLALTLNGKKKKINQQDFLKSFTLLGLDSKQQENIFQKMEGVKGEWMRFIDRSFLSDDYKKMYKELIESRFQRIEQ